MSQYQLPVVDVSTMPRVALASMNEVHTEELMLINRLGELLLQGNGGETRFGPINTAMEEWVAHTRAHFEGENRLMETYGFPPYPVHKAEHAQVLARLESLQQQWLRDRQPELLAEFIFTEWRPWFEQHVNSMDMATALYLSRMI